MARNRIIYQSQALFIAPNSNLFQLQSGELTSADDHGGETWVGSTGANIVGDSKLRSLVTPLERIQSANFNFAINRTDINEFGKLSRIDSITMEAPTVGLDFNYYLTDGGNERKLGFNVPTSALDGYDGGRAASQVYSSGDLAVSGYSALSGLIEDQEGNNYYIVVAPEGQDVHNSTVNTTDYEVVGIGNGFISDYSVEASVGAIPTASVTVEGFNINVSSNISGDAIGGTIPYAPYSPAVNFVDGTYNTGDANHNVNQFVIQGSDALAVDEINTTGDGTNIGTTTSALRPGDITFSLGNSGNYEGFVQMAGDGEAHLQSMSLSVPMSRTTLQRLGNTFGYSRVIDLPLNMEISLSVIVSELKANNLFEKLCCSETYDFTLTLYNCDSSTGQTGTDIKVQYLVKGARLESETFSNSIGDNQTADLTFSCQVGGSNDQDSGLQMIGSYNLFRTLPFFPLGLKKGQTASYSVA